MNVFAKGVVRFRIPILILSLILTIPSLYGMLHTRINYDMLTYLPEEIETMRGQDILMEDFGKGAFSLIVIEGMEEKDIAELRLQIETVSHVESAIWYDSFFDLSVPVQILPDSARNVFINDNATIMAVFFDTSSSADETIEAIGQIRALAGKQCFVSGISALVTDLKNISEREEPVYVGIAVACALLAMLLLTDSFLVPFVFLAGIGITILYNMGTNIIFGEISYITKALAAVLQLAVTMDYSIFLWHAFCANKKVIKDHEEAIAYAIRDTVVSVAGSSLTTIAGFLALCFMSYTMGRDIGLVMSKGCLLGVIGSVTILPALIMLFDKPLEKTMHRALLPDMSKCGAWITKHYPVFLAVFLLIVIPAAIGYRNTPVYYDFTQILSGDDLESISEEDLQFLTANRKLSENFNIATTHMILCDSSLGAKEVTGMLKEIEELPGVQNTLGMGTFTGNIPEEMIPQKVTGMLKTDRYQLVLVNSSYRVSTDLCNTQIDEIGDILKRYDQNGMLIGEAPCTKDLIEITDNDFTVVSWVSIGFVFAIILLTLRSLTLPVILVAVIEFAVFINLGIPYYTGMTMPFIAPICISTIQLGSTVDYAILMTTRYKELRKEYGRKDSVMQALSYAMPSVLTSALSFFAATFGVGLYSDIDLISSMCNLLARGALVSMCSVLFVLPSFLMLFDTVILHTSLGMNNKNRHENEEVVTS